MTPRTEWNRPGRIALLLALVFLAGAAARFAGVDWDGFSGLNPDERHMLFMMSDAQERLKGLDWRNVLDTWFATGASPLDARARSFYVYGDLPHMAGTLAAQAVTAEGWSDKLAIGRTLSAAFDSLTILIVFAAGLAARLPRIAAVSAAALYAAAPLAIQHAHFYVVDTTGVFFAALALLAALRLAAAPTAGRSALAGAAVGAAAACKISLAMFALLPAVAVVVALAGRRLSPGAFAGRFVLLGVVAAASCLAAFRILNPSAFAGPGLFDIAPSPRFLAQLEELAAMTRDLGGVPPGWQWTLPGIHAGAFRDLALWCVGPGLTALFLAGCAVAWRAGATLVVATGALVVLAALAVLDVPAVRYALPALPAMAVLGGLGSVTLAKSGFGRGALAALLVLAAGWGQATAAIYTSEHPRVAASRWLWEHVPPPALIATETAWDDALPVTLVVGPRHEMITAFGPGKYTPLDLMITDGDDPVKAARIVDYLARADVLEISSGRQWRVMPFMNGRFPMTARYYRALFDGSLCYGEIKRFDKPFTVFGLFALDDSGAQETWRVYDRPEVSLFRRLACFDAERARAILDGTETVRH